jgi:hypothetical protein
MTETKTVKATETKKSEAAAESKKSNRQQLAKIVELEIAPARTRRFFDANGINRNVKAKIDAVKAKLQKIKKAGGPTPPKAPENPGKDASDDAKTAYKAARAKYEEQLKAYNEYTSEAYTNLERIYNVCKLLQKVNTLLTKKERTANHTQDLKEYQAALHDEPAPKRSKESDEAFDARSKRFVKKGYAALVEGVDLNNADAVRDAMNKLRGTDENLALFFERDKEARGRIRFNDPAAVALATAMQVTLEEVVDFGIQNTRTAKKKIIKPDHCVNPDIKKLNFSSFILPLPPLKAILDRQERKKQWEEAFAKAKREAFQAAKSKARKNKTKYEKPNFTYPTFQETEVEGGFATTVEVKDDKGNTKTKYQWYGIDVDYPDSPAPVDTTDFKFYISQVCKKVLDHHIEIGDSEAQEVRFSTDLRKFFSNLIVAFIARLSPQIRILIDAMDQKTITHDVIKTALLQMLVDGYHSPTGEVSLNEEHRNLMTLIDEKVKLCQKHQTAAVAKGKAEEEDDDDDEDDDEDDHAEASKPAPHEADDDDDDDKPAAADDADDDKSDDDLDEPEEKAEKAVRPPAPTAPKAAAPKAAKPPAIKLKPPTAGAAKARAAVQAKK